jgi:uncharacterized repeat protein (TIGR02543 family)
VASCITSQWSGKDTNPQARLTVTLNTDKSDGDTAVLDWALEYVAHGYAADTSVDKSYTVTINGSAVATGTYDIDGKTGTYVIKSGSVNITKGTSAKDISFSVSFAFNLKWGGVYGGTKSASGSISIPVKTSYTVSYNANGGSGAPGSQKKWYGTNLTLSSAKPTRTGHSFQGWALSKANADDGTWYYQPGGTCGKNENLTLYAVWKANTYTVSYNANGGSGAPGKQTKTYGVTLKLSTTIPTRANYNFLGWATSASATKATYSAGGSYTANSGTTLYAIWELAYVKPRIVNPSIDRCDVNGNLADDGTYARASFEWACDHSNPTLQIEWLSDVAESGQVSHNLSGTSGEVDTVIFGAGTLSTEVTYTIKITITDSGGYATLVGTLSGMAFTIDVLAGGKGVALGKPAELEGVFDVAFQTRLLGGLLYNVLEPDTDINTVKTPGFYVGENVSNYNYVNCPLTSGTFTLEVVSAGPSGQLQQRLTLCDKKKSLAFERFYYGGDWPVDANGRYIWTGEWITPTISSQFSNYSDSTSNAPKYRKDGRLVEVRGIITPTSDIAYSTGHVTIFTLPEGYRPNIPLYILCQGSGNCTWLLRVNTDGTVGLARYRNGDTNAICNAGAWLPFQVTYFVN